MSEIGNKSPSERRQHRMVIERNFQNRFTLKICLIAGGLVLAYGSLVLFFIRLNYEMLINNAMISLPGSVDSLEREYHLYSVLLVLVLALVIAFLYAIGLLLTQKIAGPLVAVQKRLRDFGDGKTGVRLRLRRTDEFKSIETIFNYAMEAFDTRQSQEAAVMEQVQKCIQEGNKDESRRLIQQILDSRTNPKAPKNREEIKIPGEHVS